MISRLLMFVPGGQVVGIWTAIVSFLGAVFKAVMEGLSVCIANPVVFVVMGLVFVAGLYEGVRWDHRKVVAARAEVAEMKEAWKRADEESTIRYDKAIAAAKKAEDDARAWANSVGRRVRERTDASAGRN